MPGEVVPLRTSEAKVLQATMQTVANEVADLYESQGRLLREVSDYARTSKDVDNAILRRLDQIEEKIVAIRDEIHDWIRPRIESMRPKLDSVRDSVPVLVEERATEVVRRALTEKELEDLREGKADRKTLKMEVYKVVIGIVVTALLGGVSAVFLQAFLHAASLHR